MNATVIDALRYAKRLEDAGVGTRQAEAMALAINDQLTGDMATKTDLDHTAAALKADIDRVETTLKGDIAKLDAKFEAKFEAVDSRFEAVDAKIEALDGKLDTHGRHVFLVLALIAALGLYNAYRSHVVPGTAAASPAPDSPVSESTATPEPATPTQAPDP